MSRVAQPPRLARSRSWAWILGIPLAMIAIGLAAWAVLSGMPFGGDDSHDAAVPRQTRDVVTEAPAAPQSSTVAVPSTDTPARSTSVRPPAALRRSRPAIAATRAPGAITLSESQAVDRLTAFLGSAHPYALPGNCLAVTSEGYVNIGFTLDVRDTCGASPRPLGRWRVDARTGSIFRQRADGRYVAP